MTFDRVMSIGLVAARAVHFAACLLALGVFVFDRLIVAHASARHPLIERRWIGIARRLLVIALPAIALSGIAWLACVAVSDPDLPARAQIRFFWSQTQFGRLWHLRSLIFATACAVGPAALLLRRGAAPQRISSWLALLCTAALTTTLARAGHGGEGTLLHQAADGAHMLIGGAWPAGLLPLALLLRRLRREAGADRWMTTFVVANRFSVISLASVLVLGSSGIVNAWPLIGSIQFLISSTYGRTLLVKVGLFAIMIGLGAVNLLFLRPRLCADPDAASSAQRQRALNLLQLNVWLEVIVTIGIVIAVALLGTLQPVCCCDATCATP